MADNIYDWGFQLSRGQNLQVSDIGMSIYSEVKKENCYRLFLPTHLTIFGTVSKIIYLGNKNELKCLEKGDIIFGAEGFEKGRSTVITNNMSRTITNIHGITLKTEDHDLTKSIFVRCFLNFLRREGLIDIYAVGGNGGSLSIKYWNVIKIPKFPSAKRDEIAKYYYNPIEQRLKNPDLTNFDTEDSQLTSQQGIIQLDAQVKMLKERLDEIVNDLVMNNSVLIDFNFLQRN
jgi:type I restriction enzyme S subunit